MQTGHLTFCIAYVTLRFKKNLSYLKNQNTFLNNFEMAAF